MPSEQDILDAVDAEDREEAAETLRTRHDQLMAAGWDTQAEDVRERLETLDAPVEKPEEVDVAEVLSAYDVDPDDESEVRRKLEAARKRHERYASAGWDKEAERVAAEIEVLEAALEDEPTAEIINPPQPLIEAGGER